MKILKNAFILLMLGLIFSRIEFLGFWSFIGAVIIYSLMMCLSDYILFEHLLPDMADEITDRVFLLTIITLFAGNFFAFCAADIVCKGMVVNGGIFFYILIGIIMLAYDKIVYDLLGI